MQVKSVISKQVTAMAITAVMVWCSSVGAQTALQPTTQATAPTRDTTYIAPDGTAYITRVIPMPSAVSSLAQKVIARQIPDVEPASTVEETRRLADERREAGRKALLNRYPATVTPRTIAGVPVTIVTPLKDVAAKPFVLINIHGGGFQYDCCSLAESIPIASLLKAEVIAVRYRLAPEHPFPAGIDDVIAVYRDVLKSHSATEIVIYGTSAGAVMTGEVAMKLRTLACLSPPRWESFQVWVASCDRLRCPEGLQRRHQV